MQTLNDIPSNMVLARFLLAKNLPVEIKKTGENVYATYDNKFVYDGNKRVLVHKKLVPLQVGCGYEPYLKTEEWEVFLDGDKLDARLLP
ncbi:MAG: hypothetical protein PHE67_05320 [Campylobacterales bacterium]|nr:hypothetical protein [Campylobacterales bacterium]